MHRIGLTKTLAIMDTINDFFKGIIDQVTFYLENIEPWAAGLILIGVAIFVLVGLFVFLKKFVKTFIILAILGGAFYIIYTQTEILSNILKIIY
ncbi:hypothetical protein KHQ88_07330 [Mycoplasmatota bacterium]|nr:hypothetical protein KHQ88_07330 [Mycoplasmatota bacterium]